MINKTNLANGIVDSASSSSIVLKSGYVDGMPEAPFLATVSPPGELPTKSNSEIVTVTDVTGNTLTVIRAVKGTTEQSIDDGWILGNGVYAEDVGVTGVTADYLSSGDLICYTASGDYVASDGDVIEVTFPDNESYYNISLVIDGDDPVPVRVAGAIPDTGSFNVNSGGSLRFYNSGGYWNMYGVTGADLSSKQDTLVSGTNIKTINSTSVLGSGNITTPDTTYSEIGTSEIDAGTGTTLRTISGRRSKYIIDAAVSAVQSLTNWITSGMLTSNSVTASKIDHSQTGEIAYAESTTDHNGISTVTDRNDLSISFTITSGAAASGRPLWIEAWLPEVYGSAASRCDMSITDSSNNAISVGYFGTSTGGANPHPGGLTLKRRLTPSAGNYTYKVRISRGVGTGTLSSWADSVSRAYIRAYYA